MTVTVNEQLPLLAAAPNGVRKLRELILELAVRGKLVAQDASDEPVSELLKRIAAEKRRLVAEGMVKPSRSLTKLATDDGTNDLPRNWESVRLGEVVDVLDGLRRPVTKKDREPGPYPYYGASGIVDYVSTYIFDEPLVLVGEDGAKWGAGEKTAFQISGKTWVNNHAHVVRPNRLLLLDGYLVVALVGMDLASFITGTTVPKLNQAKLVSIEIPLPPLAEQRRIVAKVDELMALCDRLEAQQADAESAHAQLVATLLDSLTRASDSDDFAASWQRLSAHFHTLFITESSIDALKQALLQLAVMGKLVPQDPSDESARELLKRIAPKAEFVGKRQKRDSKSSVPERPFDPPAGWEWIRLSDLQPEFQNGVSSRGDSDGVLVTVIRLADIKAGEICLDETRELTLSAATVSKSALKIGDVLIIRVNGSADLVGRFVVCRTASEAIPCDHFIRMRLPHEVIDSAYLKFAGDSEVTRASIAGLFVSTAGQKTVNQGHIGSLVVPLPPLAEQHRIVAKVDQMIALCDQLRSRLTQARQFNEQLAVALVQRAVA